MSLTILSGLEYYKYHILKKMVAKIFFKREMQCEICNLSKQHMKREMFICYNYHCFDNKFKDVVMICPKCMTKQKKKFPLSYNNLLELMLFLKTLWDRHFYQEGIQKTQIVKLSMQKKIKQGDFKSIIAEQTLKYIQRKLYGFHQVQKVKQVQKYYKQNNKLIQLIQELVHNIKQSYLGQYVMKKHRLKYLNINSQLIDIYDMLLKRQKLYKLQIMDQIQTIINQTKILQNLSQFIGKLLDGLDNFQNAFYKNKFNEKIVLFAMNRDRIQYRQLNQNPETEKDYSQLVRTELYFIGKPILFKVSTNQQHDFVEIGIILIPKNKSQRYQHYPASLHRFMIVPRGHIDTQTYIDYDIIHQTKTDQSFRLKDKKQPHLRIFQNTSQLFNYKLLNNSQQLYQIQTETQLILSFSTKTFRIQNKTTDARIVEEKLKGSNDETNYYIYPCVRLIGSKVIIENEGFLDDEYD